jgi:hypothetical protein
VSATPEQIAELCERLKKRVLNADDLDVASSLIRAQADALKRIAEMDGDQPARSDWDMVRIARKALGVSS